MRLKYRKHQIYVSGVKFFELYTILILIFMHICIVFILTWTSINEILFLSIKLLF